LCVRATNCGGTGPETCITLIAPEGGKCFVLYNYRHKQTCNICCLLCFIAPTVARNLTASPGRNNVTLMWLSPIQPNGNVSYSYSISETASGVSVASEMTTSLSAVVESLRAFTNYTFTVTAMTSAGSSASVMETFMTLQGCELPLK